MSSTQFITFSLFQSTLPAREATDKLADKLNVLAISIHPSREGSDPFLSRITVFLPPISIHASREGSDVTVNVSCLGVCHISIHASRGGSDDTMEGLTFDR